MDIARERYAISVAYINDDVTWQEYQERIWLLDLLEKLERREA